MPIVNRGTIRLVNRGDRAAYVKLTATCRIGSLAEQLSPWLMATPAAFVSAPGTCSMIQVEYSPPTFGTDTSHVINIVTGDEILRQELRYSQNVPASLVALRLTDFFENEVVEPVVGLGDTVTVATVAANMKIMRLGVEVAVSQQRIFPSALELSQADEKLSKLAFPTSPQSLHRPLFYFIPTTSLNTSLTRPKCLSLKPTRSHTTASLSSLSIGSASDRACISDATATGTAVRASRTVFPVRHIPDGMSKKQVSTFPTFKHSNGAVLHPHSEIRAAPAIGHRSLDGCIDFQQKPKKSASKV